MQQRIGKRVFPNQVQSIDWRRLVLSLKTQNPKTSNPACKRKRSTGLWWSELERRIRLKLNHETVKPKHHWIYYCVLGSKMRCKKLVGFQKLNKADLGRNGRKFVCYSTQITVKCGPLKFFEPSSPGAKKIVTITMNQLYNVLGLEEYNLICFVKLKCEKTK